MGLSKQEFSNGYVKGTVFVMDYPAMEFREHFVSNTIYSDNSRINAEAQIASINMLRRTVQGMKHGDKRLIRLHTIVCEPLSAVNADIATFKQYEFANVVSGAVVSILFALTTKKLPKK